MFWNLTLTHVAITLTATQLAWTSLRLYQEVGSRNPPPGISHTLFFRLLGSLGVDSAGLLSSYVMSPISQCPCHFMFVPLGIGCFFMLAASWLQDDASPGFISRIHILMHLQDSHPHSGSLEQTPAYCIILGGVLACKEEEESSY